MSVGLGGGRWGVRVTHGGEVWWALRESGQVCSTEGRGKAWYD